MVDALDRKTELLQACDAVRATLGGETTPSVRVARLLAPWLGSTLGAPYAARGTAAEPLPPP